MKNEVDYLHIGDPVWHRGSWGTDDPKMAEVAGIETNCDSFTHNGIGRKRLPWSKIDSPKNILSLHNGHWAYGFQISPVEMWKKTYEEKG